MTTETTQTRVEGTLDPLLGNDGLPWPQTFDGQTWAKEFIRHVQERPEIATDEGTMIGWFANAIMVGYDRARQEPNVAGQGAAKPYPAPACSPLPPCALCGRTEYPVEYGPRQNKLPAGSLVGFDNGERVWICRRCSRDPAALERLETDASLTANSVICESARNQTGATP